MSRKYKVGDTFITTQPISVWFGDGQGFSDIVPAGVVAILVKVKKYNIDILFAGHKEIAVGFDHGFQEDRSLKRIRK